MKKASFPEYLKSVFFLKNIKRLSIVFILAITVIGGVNVYKSIAAADSDLYFSPATDSVAIDTDFTIDVMIDPGVNLVNGVETFITFDQTKLRLDDIALNAAAFPLALGSEVINNTNGTANISGATNWGETVNGAPVAVATFSFHSLDLATDSPLTITSSSLITADNESGNVLVNRTGATVTVTDALGATIPTILSVSSDKAAGSYTTGEVIDIDVTFSEAVTSTGDVTVTLETGTPDRTCAFAVTNATTGTCNYTVQAGDTSLDLTTNLIAGTIEDQVGDALVNFTPATNLAANEALVIDTTAPIINTPVEISPNPIADETPGYGFTSDEGGTINYGGSCAEGNTVASSGVNTAIFGGLADGTFADCTISVTDLAGNESNTLAVGSFSVDVTAPTGGDFVINSDDASTNSASVTLDVTCPTDSWATVQMAVGNTPNPSNWDDCVTGFFVGYTLSAGDGTKTVYMRFRDGGLNTTDDVTDTISLDTGAPTVTQVTAVTSPINDTTPNYTFNTDESGAISYAGDCESSDTTATLGNNTITFDTPLGAGAHTNCTITVTDALLNASTPLDVNDFTIDLTAPVISEVTAVATPTVDNSPDYTFTTSEAGTISYGGDCDSTDDSATSGSNTITFDAMPDGDYINCTIIVTDAATNNSNILNVTPFTVDSGVPFLSGGSPSGELNDGTTTATLLVTTSEAATCRFGMVAGTAYASIANIFTTTGGTSHSSALTGLSDGNSYSYYVRCEDANGNPNVVDYVIFFSVDKEGKKEEVASKRKIGNTPKTVARGKILVEYGKKFSKNSDVALYFTRSDGTYYPPRIMRTNSKGSFSLTYLVPMSKMTGKYKWYAVDLKTGWKSPKRTYRVK